LLATGESFRAQKIEEMVSWNEEVGHVVGKTEHDTLQVTVTRGVVQGKRVQKRLYKVNGTGRRRQDLVGLLPAVLFKPEDMDLIGGEPSLRRSFLDEVLVQVDREYRWSLASYQKGLRQRNRVLDQVREGRSTQTALYFWDQLLIKEGAVIHEKRSRLVETINQVDSGRKQLVLRYTPSVVSPEKFASHLSAELALGYTLSGPHKDDLKVFDGSRDLATYGSRGEQRMAVLWLKRAQIEVMEDVIKVRPMLLLDDILSELDHHHVEEVVGLCRKQQTILTTTDEALSDYFGNGNTVIRLGAE
jgi:DNA replication and repair protein RecF